MATMATCVTRWVQIFFNSNLIRLPTTTSLALAAPIGANTRLGMRYARISRLFLEKVEVHVLKRRLNASGALMRQPI